MAAPSVQERVLQALLIHRHELEGSLLYLDAGSAEAVATGIGLAALQDGEPAATVAPACETIEHLCAHAR